MSGVTKPKGLFVTGTDTGVGKTHVTCMIARQVIRGGFRVAAYKPVCSGAMKPSPSIVADASESGDRWDDIERLKQAMGGVWPDDVICPQRFIAPLAPPVAARLEGKTVNFQGLLDGVRCFHGQEMLLIEGAGGWLSPLTETQTIADLAQALRHPILVVAKAGLGTINQTLLTVESIRFRGLCVAGIVLNEATVVGDDPSICTNSDEIEARSGVPVFGTIPHGSSTELLRTGISVNVRWQNLFA